MRTPAQLHTEGWNALVKELGLADALRYRILFESGTGDYVKERKVLFGQMSMDDWLQELEQWEQSRRKKD